MRRAAIRRKARSLTIVCLCAVAVSCSHGATVAPVDPEQFFYLQSRGLASDQAVGLIVRGFLAQAFERLPGGLPAVVGPWVDRRLDQIQREWR